MRWALLGILWSIPILTQAIQIVGHRGAAALSPENTLDSYRTALEIGVHTIDIDVVQTQDGVVVANHDPHLHADFTREPSGHWLGTQLVIGQLSFAELQQYHIGSVKPDSAYTQLFPLRSLVNPASRIPSLREVIEYAERLSGGCIQYQIEIKTNPERPYDPPHLEELTRQVVAIVNEYNVAHRTQIHSFDWRSILLVQQLSDIITPSYISETSGPDSSWGPPLWTAGYPLDAPAQVPAQVAALGGKVWCPYHHDLRQEDVNRAHALGLRVQPWTVDAPEDMIRLIQMGVDGIISNRPDVLKGILAAFGELSPGVCSAQAAA